MPQQTQVLRSISWRDLCPWLLLTRAFSLAISPSILLLGTVAALLIPIGWQLGGQVFLTEADLEQPGVRAIQSHWERFPGAASQDSRSADSWPKVTQPGTWLAPIRAQMGRLSDIAIGIGDSVSNFGVRRLAYVVLGVLWTLFIAALFGGAISRKSVVFLGRDESIGLAAAISHAWRHLLAYMLAPLYPVLMICLIVLFAGGLGFTMRLGIFAALAGVIWWFALLGGAVAAILMLGLLAGWPLMWGAVSAEQDGEAFEALSRSYSYVLGRPLHLLFYAVFAALIGSIGLVVVGLFCDLTIALTTEPADWGSGGRLAEMLGGGGGWMEGTGGSLIGVQNQIVKSASSGYQFAFFWAAAAGVYLLLRSDVDHTELDEVYVPEEGETLSLPSLQLDATGAVTLKKEDEAEPPAKSDPTEPLSEDSKDSKGDSKES